MKAEVYLEKASKREQIATFANTRLISEEIEQGFKDMAASMGCELKIITFHDQLDDLEEAAKNQNWNWKEEKDMEIWKEGYEKDRLIRDLVKKLTSYRPFSTAKITDSYIEQDVEEII